MADTTAKASTPAPKGDSVGLRQSVLADVPLFRSLSKRHLREVARVSHIREYANHQIVVEEGAAGSSLFVVLDGYGRVLSATRRIGSLSPGDFFGEVALFAGGRRTATVQADGPLRCVELPGEELDRILDAEPGMARALLRELSSRLRDLAGYRPTRMQQLLLS